VPRDYDEKRDFIRISVDCEIQFKAEGAQQMETGHLSNLSGRGMMFIAARQMPLETRLEVRIEADNNVTAPLHALVRVVRVVKQRRSEAYEIGAIITGIMDD
jgi:hypothetical protein